MPSASLFEGTGTNLGASQACLPYSLPHSRTVGRVPHLVESLNGPEDKLASEELQIPADVMNPVIQCLLLPGAPPWTLAGFIKCSLRMLQMSRKTLGVFRGCLLILEAPFTVA